MTKDKAKKAGEVMIAWANGKEIECRVRNKYLCSRDSWDLTDDPSFNWHEYQYRIKPEPKLVPFTFEDAFMFVGRNVKAKYFKWMCNVIEATSEGVYLGIQTDVVSYEEFLKEYQFIDESPCGKIISE